MKRIILVYNPHSSRYQDVQKEVLAPARELKGYMIGKYEVEPTDVDKNAIKLAKIIKNDDLILSVGGDATAVISANAIIRSNKDAHLSALPYGNFNDLAHTLGTKTLTDVIDKAPTKLYPLEILVDNKLFRYATCYVTIGMTAEAVKLYDTPSLRKKLKSGFGRKIGSYTSLAGWYFKNRHKKVFLPEFKLNGVKKHPKTSDYAAVNGHYMARVMRGGEDYLKPKTFRSETDRLTNFWRLTKLMLKSIFHRIPGSDTTGDTLEFLQPANVELQAEGEYIKLENINSITIRKGTKCLKVIKN